MSKLSDAHNDFRQAQINWILAERRNRERAEAQRESTFN